MAIQAAAATAPQNPGASRAAALNTQTKPKTETISQPNKVDVQTPTWRSQLMQGRQQAQRKAQQAKAPNAINTTLPQLPKTQSRQPTGMEVLKKQAEEIKKQFETARDKGSKLGQLKAARQGVNLAKDVKGTAKDAVKSEVRKQVKKQVKKLIIRGANFIVNAICAVLDIGTAGVGIIVTFVIQVLSLGYLNVETWYGWWYTKGKSIVIDPIEWQPIPLMDKLDKSKMIITSIVIAADLALLLLCIIAMLAVTFPIWVPVALGAGILNYIGIL